MKTRRIVWSIVGLLSLAVAAQAGPVTFQFAGEIYYVRDPDNLLGGAVTIGSPFSGSYTFESTTPDVDPDSRRGLYEGALLDVIGQVGGLDYHGPRGARNAIEIQDGYGGTGLTSESYVIRSDIFLVDLPLDLHLGVAGRGANALQGDVLPTTPPEIDRFTDRFFDLLDTSEQIPVGLFGYVTTLVPEPWTIVMVLGGALVTIRRSYKHPRNPRGKASGLAAMVLLMVPGYMGRAARAGPVTFQFAGEITHIYDPDNLLGGAITIGTPFSGSYTFESTTPDVDADPRRGLYEGALLNVEGQVGALGYHGPRGARNAIKIEDAFAATGLSDESYLIRSDVFLVGLPLDLILGVAGLGANALQGDVLPMTPPEIDRFTGRFFDLGDTSEQIPVNVSGFVLMLVPEPCTIIMVLGGALVITRRQSRHRRKQRGGTSALTAIVLVGVALALGNAPARATDCNANGVDDASELGQCRVDLVYIVDTSSSMREAIRDLLCPRRIPDLNSALTQRGVILHAETLRIPSTPPTVECTCCTDSVQALSVQALYGSSTPCLPESLGSCSYDEDNNEDWAPATGIVAGNKSWTCGAMRIIVPIADEGPRCGDVINDPGDDRDAVNHAVPIVRTNRVIVVPLVSGVPQSSEYALASAFAEGGGRCGNVFSFNDAGVVDKIVELVLRHCPADCNRNGTLDECDLSAGTSADCYGNSDCVPDECQPSRDCNGNEILDDCDLACGAPDSPCDVPGCGQGTDCNRDCILDACESTADCNANGILDLCDIAAGMPDVDMDSVPDECAACCFVDPYGEPLCENRTSAGCLEGTSYTLPGGGPGPTCGDDCTCGTAACCCCGSAECNNAGPAGCDCVQLNTCECEWRGGFFLSPPHRTAVLSCTSPTCRQGTNNGNPCTLDSDCTGGGICVGTCVQGSCCVAPGECRDQVSESDQTKMTKAICDEPAFDGNFIGGVRCYGGTCTGSNAGRSCNVNAQCPQGTCTGGADLLAQPSPCPAPPPPPVPPPPPSPGEIVWDCDPVSADRTTRSLRFKVAAATPAAPPEETAIKVELVDLQNPVPPNGTCCPAQNFGSYESATCTPPGETGGCARWVGEPGTFLEAQDNPTGASFRAARLQCSPFYADWVGETASGAITVVGAEIMPSSEYSVQAYGASCMGSEGCCANVSAPVTMFTRRHGDVNMEYNPPRTSTQPDVIDVNAVVNKFKNVTGAKSKAVTQLQPNVPELNGDINALAIVAVVDAVKGLAYPFPGPCSCPSPVTCDLRPCLLAPDCRVCVGGRNPGAWCSDDPDCTGGGDCGGPTDKALGICVRTCDSGANAGRPCINSTHCNYCSGGTTYNGVPCDPGATNPCPDGGTCGAGKICSAGHVGTSCDTDVDCTVTGQCRDWACTAGNIGRDCTADDQCNVPGQCAWAAPSSCGALKCRGGSNPGSLCTDDGICLNGGKCASKTCRDRCGRCN